MSYAIRVENLGKRYELGATHAGSVRELVNRAWSRVIGRNDAPVAAASLDPEAGDRVEGNAFWALRDVSFEVKPGEVVGIIGRNGSGKSTLLKILSQITAPTTGRVELHGRVASLLEVGTGFHPELSGRENIYLNGAILGMSKLEIRRKFDEIVAFAEIEKFIDTPVKRYSSGMYIRLAFAVAAHLEPEILIVDEVLAVGDMEFQKKCLGKMSAVAQGGRTVIFVSHNPTAIRQLCSHCLMLQAGQLVLSSDVESCLRKYNALKSRNRTIVEHLTYQHQSVKIETVEINGVSADELILSSTDRNITICVSGQIVRPFRGDIEVRLHDINSSPIGFFSPAFDRGSADMLKEGAFSISRTLRLPRMNQGVLGLSIFLADPNKTIWAEIQNAAYLQFEGSATATGQVFAARDGAGPLFLEEVSA